MIDERSTDCTGWARFSDDRTKRYRLGRALTGAGRVWVSKRGHSTVSGVIFRAVFLMLNPSTADAFKLDPTVKRCAEFARRWGADVLEVVNLFALRSPYPEDLRAESRAAPGACGDFPHVWRWRVGADSENDAEILDACRGAQRVIAAWGNHGRLADRDIDVATMLAREGVKLEALRVLDSGVPSHPLARGKNFIPYDTEPVRYSP